VLPISNTVEGGGGEKKEKLEAGGKASRYSVPGREGKRGGGTSAIFDITRKERPNQRSAQGRNQKAAG